MRGAFAILVLRRRRPAVTTTAEEENRPSKDKGESSADKTHRDPAGGEFAQSVARRMGGIAIRAYRFIGDHADDEGEGEGRRLTALGDFNVFRVEFDALIERMDTARAGSLTPPDRFFKKAQTKINSGDYDFGVDLINQDNHSS